MDLVIPDIALGGAPVKSPKITLPADGSDVSENRPRRRFWSELSNSLEMADWRTVLSNNKMSRTNAYLLNSLMWNLREMTTLIKIMRNKVGDDKCSSWRHPLLSCGELDVLQLLEDNKGSDRYTYLLELTFDRLIYILNLMVKYLESFDALAKFKPGKNIERPRNLSMASILYMIWDRMQAHCESPNESSKPKNFKSFVSSSYTQSDVTLMSACSTCELAQNLVTQIVLKMENYFGEDTSSSALLTQRKLMKEKLIGTSNWSAMMTWVNAVLKDLSNMFEESQKFKADNRKLKSRIDSGEASLMAKLKKHDEEAKIMQRICKESEDKIKILEREIRSVREEKQKQLEELAELRSKNTELHKHLVEAEAKKKVLEDRMLKREKLDQERNIELRAKLETEIRKKESVQRDVENLKRLFKELESQISEANSRCNLLEAKMEQAAEENNCLREENTRLLSSLNEKQKEVDKFASKLLEAFPDISEESKNKYKGTGDPLTDMKHQVEANKLRISQLILQNENLLQTISRIEAIRK